MQIAFGLFILLILIIGLYNRRKQNKVWIAEERQEESGGWIDKRAGERGTFGSRDAEMEQERRETVRQGRIIELARLIRTWAFEQYPGFHDLSDAQITAFSVFTRTNAAQWITGIEQTIKSSVPEPPNRTPADNALSLTLKKQILDFSYQHYPTLLDLDIEAIRKLDRLAGNVADTLLGVIEEVKQKK